MTHSMRKSLLGSVGAFIVTLGIAASGWSMSQSESELAGATDKTGERIEHRVSHMARKLDLSDEQKVAITELISESHLQVAGDKARMQELKRSLKNQRTSFDPEALRVAADEIGELTGRMVYQRASTHVQIYQLLSENQQAKMDSMMEKRSKHRDARRGHRRGHRGGHMGGLHI